MGGASAKITYILRDNFATAESAPLATPRTCEPGPGALVITDTTNKLSIASAKLVCTGGSGAGFGDPGFVGAALTRGAFLTAYAKVIFSVQGYWNVGFGRTNSGGATEAAFYTQGAGLYINHNAATVDIATNLVNATSYEMAAVLKASGASYYIKGGAWAAWTELYDSADGATATIYPNMANFDTQFQMDDFIVCTIPNLAFLPLINP
jgi:hypothetical protein